MVSNKVFTEPPAMVSDPLKIKGLTDYNIVDWCKRYKLPLRNIFMRDEISSKALIETPSGSKISNELNPGFYIINFDDSSGNGTHWVCLCINNVRNLYFDPLATPVLDEVLQFNVLANTYALQDVRSRLCGHWCCAFMYYINKAKDKSPVDAYYNFTHKEFTQDAVKNEDKLVNKVFNLK
eukprot:TRINITY_DN699_c0_g2_i1.p1 TRINITY_DN699_c0_g2~~TRINITY_DN699_c0_g2_i1.p1  ORF type:complete len:180 (-),score=0.85 TRINITY_DN699_c0_g2_i1:575-1114(-)